MRIKTEGDGFVEDYGAVFGESWVVGFEDLAEADEGVHLMQVAADLGGEAGELENVVVGFEGEEVSVRLKAEEDAVEEVPALGVAVGGGVVGEVEEGFGGVRAGDGWAGGGFVWFEGEG